MQNFMIALFECSVSMTAIGILYMAATPFLQRRFTAKGRYYAWLAVIIGFIVPFRLHLPASVISIDTLIPPLENAINQTVSPAAAAAVFSWHTLAGSLWFAGVIVFLAYHVIRHRRFLHMVKRWSTECSNRQWLHLMQDVQADMNITRKVDLRVCPGIPCPMLIGFVRPVILLPSDNIAVNELLFVLKHELIHLKRGDSGYKMLVFAATALHWFNPFVYRMAREIALQCELSCDEEVIKHSDTNNRQQYVEAIIGIMKKQSRGQSVFSTSFSDSRLSMKKRVLSIMDTRSKKWGISVLATIVLAMFGIGAVLQLSPTKSETALPEPARPIKAAGSAVKQEENNPPASLADPVSQANDPEGKESGPTLEPGVPESDVSVPEAMPLLIPDQETTTAVSSESDQGENKSSVLFAGPGISRR